MNSFQTSLNNFETKNKQYWNKIRKQMTNIYLNKVDDNNELKLLALNFINNELTLENEIIKDIEEIQIIMNRIKSKLNTMHNLRRKVY